VERDGTKTNRQGGSSTGQTDTVSITDMASRLHSLEKKLASAPDVDQDHVNRVRDAISRGEYRIDPDRVADKMMDFESDF
jgi:negative regulator of flagellin synthesis FlgM